MSNRFLRFILALYPRGFRRRYGREVQDIVNDLEASGDHSRLWLVSGLLVSAVAERLQAVRQDARLTIPTLTVVAALGASVGLHWLRGGQVSRAPSRTPARTCRRQPSPPRVPAPCRPRPVNQPRSSPLPG